MQGSLAQERTGRARMVASLRQTIDGLRAAGDVQGRLKVEIVGLHDQLTAARDAQVLSSTRQLCWARFSHTVTCCSCLVMP
jgi:hypothetical protein